jgi:cytochrome c-type biogenesis protein CcmH/NrfF
MAPQSPSSNLVARVALVAGLLLIFGALMGAPLAVAQETETDTSTPAANSDKSPEEINAISHNLSGQFMSPYCPGKTLRDCTSGKAAVLRDEIHVWVQEGKSRQWIEDELVRRHGESILAAPKFKGFNALVWLFPFIALLVGLGLVFGYLQRQSSVKLATSVPASELSEDFVGDVALDAELEQELTDRQS